MAFEARSAPDTRGEAYSLSCFTQTPKVTRIGALLRYRAAECALSSNGCVGSLLPEAAIVAQPTPSAKVRFLVLPPVHWAELEGLLRVDLTRSPSRRRTTGICAKPTTGVHPNRTAGVDVELPFAMTGRKQPRQGRVPDGKGRRRYLTASRGTMTTAGHVNRVTKLQFVARSANNRGKRTS